LFFEKVVIFEGRGIVGGVGIKKEKYMKKRSERIVFLL